MCFTADEGPSVAIAILFPPTIFLKRTKVLAVTRSVSLLDQPFVVPDSPADPVDLLEELPP